MREAGPGGVSSDQPATDSILVEQPGADLPPPEGGSPLRLALIVATSALLGGITVALWNRRILEGMRQPVAPRPPEEQAEGSREEEFI